MRELVGPHPENAARRPEAGERATLGLWDAVSVIIGIVIGAGIYETSPLVMQSVAGPLELFTVWALGGLLSLVGALCYAELASTYPRSGGDYVYLSRAYAPIVGFLFGWAQLTVILTGSIGMMAYVFADYAAALWSVTEGQRAIFAGASVVALTLLNLVSTSVGKTAQNVLTALKILGVVMVLAAGLAFAGRGEAPPAGVTSLGGTSSFGLAMILVLYTFGGWNDAAFVAAEVRDARRNLPRALVLGTLAITLAYFVMNAAFVVALGFERARQSQAIAADVLDGAFGPAGRRAMAVVVMVSALGAVNGLVFTGSRVYATLGRDYRRLAALGRWHPRLGSPVWSLSIQLAITIAMIGLVGTSFGRSLIDGALVALGLSPATWAGHGGFDTLLRATAPVFWLFFLLTGISVFVLRVRDRSRERPFRVPLYPVLPIVFCATCAYMLYSAVAYAGTLTAVGLLPLVLGIPVYFVSRRSAAPVALRSDPMATRAE